MRPPRLLFVVMALGAGLTVQVGRGPDDVQEERTAVDYEASAAVSVGAAASAMAASPTDGLFDVQRFADTISLWNAEILWAPAAATADPVTRFGDQLRSVFGPIPDGDCTGPASRRLGLEVDGNIVELEPNPGKYGSPLEFAHRDLSGRVVKWTTNIPKCDKPSLAGGVTFCGINSRISRVKSNHVEWLFLCRKSSDDLELHDDPYWTAKDPRFSRYSAIGFNDITGEIAFIDGRKDRAVFDWSMTFPPPGGQSYLDAAGRSSAEALYDGTFQVNCVACHDNKKPAIIDPYMQHARVGYFEDGDGSRAAKFSLGNFIPGRVARTDAPFRVIGSDYTAEHGGSMRRANVFAIQGHSCSSCHTLTTTQTGRRFAADAAGMLPTLESPTVAQNAAMLNEQAELRLVRDHRTEWASSSGAGGIMPWMVPKHGGKLSKGTRELSAPEWKQLSECAWVKGGDVCNYRSLFTSCPPPGEDGDTFVPSNFSIDPMSSPGEHSPVRNFLRLKWKYLNGYGDVPQRDDVRFDVAISVENIPPSRTAPAVQEYPSVDEAKGIHSKSPVSGSAVLVENASFDGHRKWTDPPPTDKPRLYSIDIPAICGKRYLVTVLPKRFCFDNAGIAYSTTNYLAYRDNVCTE